MFGNYDIVTPAKKGCKFCGSKTVTWQEGSSGKWYLSEVFEIDGETRSNRADLHSKYCKKGELDHATEQAKISRMERDREAEREHVTKAQQAKRDEDGAAHFIALAGMSAAEKLAEIEKLERAMLSHFRNPPTMDYFTEFNREIEAQRRRQVDWKYLKALVGDPQEDDFTWQDSSK